MTLIIAEAGINHNGDINLAKELIHAAKESGADIVKFQTFKTDLCITKDTPIVDYQKENCIEKNTQYELVKNLELSFEQFEDLKNYSEKLEIEFLSTGFDLPSLEFLNKIKIKRFKIPSGEITNFPYLRKISSFKKPVIISTGMANIIEINNALDIFLNEGISKNNITILHCTTQYPTSAKDVNLNAMQTISKIFDINVGYSDHTEGVDIALSAVAMGAIVIEKHLTIDKNLKGPDHKASIEPHEFKEMSRLIRRLEEAKGDGIKKPTNSELKIMKLVRKSIVAKKRILKGDLFTNSNLIVKRPGTGISPMHWDSIIGKYSSKDYQEDELIQEEKFT